MVWPNMLRQDCHAKGVQDIKMYAQCVGTAAIEAGRSLHREVTQAFFQIASGGSGFQADFLNPRFYPRILTRHTVCPLSLVQKSSLILDHTRKK